MKSDEEIQRAVQRELEWDSRVDHAGIGVAVHRGVVMLSGSTACWSHRVAAQNAAHRVAGVRDVANEIRLGFGVGGTRTDADIAEAVRSALEWNARVPHEAIRSTVSNGQITLEGEVDCLSERDDAEHAIEHLKGVQLVINKVQVKERSVPRATNVRGAIFEALERRAAKELHRIRIEEADGIVILSGTCQTWAEKKAVVGAARGTRGVRSVRDQLRISP